jgi:hypothetical protein
MGDVLREEILDRMGELIERLDQLMEALAAARPTTHSVAQPWLAT